jgi:DNA repair photolyase
VLRLVEVKARRALTASGIYGVDFSLNPYIGCQHACAYCYVPYTYRFQEPSAWGREVKVKVNLPRLLRREAASLGSVRVLVSSITDPYQPLEARLCVTRACLEALKGSEVEVVILTKSDLFKRDLDVLKSMRRCELGVTVTTLKAPQLLEPGSPPPMRRVEALKEASREGFETFLFLGPLMPRLVDDELAQLLDLAVNAGCSRVVVDKLRLRPRMEERLAPALSHFMDPSLAFRLAQRRTYYEELKGRVLELAEERGLEADFCY